MRTRHIALAAALVAAVFAVDPFNGIRSVKAAVAPNGQIAFAEDLCCAYDIWIVNPDGTGLTNLTNTPDTAEFDPSWSPDGSRIAFVREEDIWVMNGDGTGQTNLTNSPEPELQPDWSADGTRLVFIREVPGAVIATQFDVFTMSVDGTGQRNITGTDEDEFDPAWSPDGGRIAFAAVRNGDWEIVTSDADGSNEAVLTLATQEDRAPDWSPDGSKIVWMSAADEPCCGDWEIWAMNADGSGATNLTVDPAGDMAPSWSPDGSEIAFITNRTDGWSTEAWVIAAPPSLPVNPLQPLLASASAAARRLTGFRGAAAPSWGTAPAAFRLTVTRTGNGSGSVTSAPAGIDCGLDCTQSFPQQSLVVLEAKAAAGASFAGWGGACTGTASCTVTIDAAKTVTASFVSSTRPVVAVAVSDAAFSPSWVKAPFGATVMWTLAESRPHALADATGLRLFSSGLLSAASVYAFSFSGAGSYPYICVLHGTRGGVQVPVRLLPAKGAVYVAWASEVPAGYVFDVQVHQPGTPAFSLWRTGETRTGSWFVPNAGPGPYSFRARMRHVASATVSGYSPVASVTFP